MLYYDIENYVKKCNICLTSKTFQYKFYCNLQFLPILIYCCKDSLIDFITNLLILTDWKGNSYDLIFVIINKLTKMIYYKLVKITINIPGLVKVIVNIVVRYYGLLILIITNKKSLFTSKLLSLLCYFSGIK